MGLKSCRCASAPSSLLLGIRFYISEWRAAPRLSHLCSSALRQQLCWQSIARPSYPAHLLRAEVRFSMLWPTLTFEQLPWQVWLLPECPLLPQQRQRSLSLSWALACSRSSSSSSSLYLELSLPGGSSPMRKTVISDLEIELPLCD